MAADIKNAGVLADVVRYGVPWHGRVEGGVLNTGKLDALDEEVTRTWPQPASSDCWLVQRPGLPDPYLGDAAGKTADALEGKELTNYALLAGAGNIHGKAFSRTNDYKHRWLWVDDSGEVFSVSFGLVAGTAQYGDDLDYDGFTPRDWSFGSDITARFYIRRYGDLRKDGDPIAPGVTQDHVIAAGALGQSTPSLTGISGGNMILRDLSPTGAAAIMELHSLVFDTARNRTLFGVLAGRPFASHREVSNPLGFVKFALSGTGAAPVVSMSLLATRAQALGSYSHTRPNYSLTSAQVCDQCADGNCWYACSFTESWRITTEFTGRIVGYQFDSAGVAQPVTLNHTHHADRTQTVTPVTTTSGSETVQQDNLYSASLSAGANTLSIASAWHSLLAQTYTGASCSATITTSSTTDSGVPEWSTAETTSSATGDCTNLAFEYFAAEATCGTECRLPSTFTAFDMTDTAFRLPSALDSGGMALAAFRFGAGLFSLFGGLYYTPGMGSTGLVNAATLQKAYAVWNADRTSYSRIYGARNPATGAIAFPKAGPVNFA